MLICYSKPTVSSYQNSNKKKPVSHQHRCTPSPVNLYIWATTTLHTNSWVTIEEKNVPDKYLHCFNSTFINSSTGWRPAGGSLSGRGFASDPVGAYDVFFSAFGTISLSFFRVLAAFPLSFHQPVNCSVSP